MSSTTSGGSTTADMSEDVWLFGYGSIMWKTGFDFEEARLAQIHGWSRRFWQGSGDHRGTPAAPGRVVTLIESYGEICHGMAYRLHGLKVTAILEELDYREKNGYERVDLAIGFADGSQVRGITYHATPDNPHEIARQILTSEGPSGTNKEYILRLKDALDAHGITDQHIDELVTAILQMEADL